MDTLEVGVKEHGKNIICVSAVIENKPDEAVLGSVDEPDSEPRRSSRTMNAAQS